MAEKQEPANDNSRAAAADQPAKDAGLIEKIVTGAASVVSSMWNAVTADGYLAAAGRQGFGELGAALKAFPDSIQVNEPGTLWNPTQGEIAADRDHSADGPPHPWPSEIASQNRNLPDKGNGYENGKDTGYSM